MHLPEIASALGGFLLVLGCIGYSCYRCKVARRASSREQVLKLRDHVDEAISKLGLVGSQDATQKIDSLETPRSHIHICNNSEACVDEDGSVASRRGSG